MKQLVWLSSVLLNISSRNPFDNTYTSDTEVLEKANVVRIKVYMYMYRFRWAGHIMRLGDDRIPKQSLYGGLSIGSRPEHKSKEGPKDYIKYLQALLTISINLKLMNMAEYVSQCRLC